MRLFLRRMRILSSIAPPSTLEISDALRFYSANLVWLVLAMCVFGLLMGYSASATRLISEGLSPTREIISQAAWTGIGVLVMLVISIIPIPRDPSSFWVYLAVKCTYWVSVVFLVLVLVVAKVINGSVRTLDFGSIHFQPTELAKIGLVVYLLYLLIVEAKRWTYKRLSWGVKKVNQILFDVTKPKIRILTAFGATGIVLFLTICQPDIGSTIFLAVFAVVALLLGRVRPSAILAFFLVAGIAVGLYMYADRDKFSHASSRWVAFLNPLGTTEVNAAGELVLPDLTDKESYQITQSLGAVANGGIGGIGYFRGQQKINRLPEATNDFIFSVICEELGLAGVLLVVGAFLGLIYLVSRIALCLRVPFYSALVFLLGFGILLQACVNMSYALGILPTTGMTLPLISFGGTSKVVTLAEIGIILAIAKSSIRWDSTRV